MRTFPFQCPTMCYISSAASTPYTKEVFAIFQSEVGVGNRIEAIARRGSDCPAAVKEVGIVQQTISGRDDSTTRNVHLNLTTCREQRKEVSFILSESEKSRQNRVQTLNENIFRKRNFWPTK